MNGYASMIYVIISAGIIILALLGWILYRRRQATQHRLVAIVGLQKTEKYLDADMIAAAAKRAWNADLGSGDAEGTDGFVVGAAPSTIIRYQDRMLLINSFTTPYVKDPEEVSKSIVDLRLQKVMAEHTAWFSCDAMGVDHKTSPEEIKQWYALLGKLFVELLDDDCLGIYLPDEQRLYAINDRTFAALRSDDVFASLQEELDLPIISIPPDDPAMKAAVATAHQNWPQFLTAYESRLGKDFTVKAPITSQGSTEFIWLEVTAIENDVIYGKLANDPGFLPGLFLGSQVKTSVSALNDWMYIDQDGEVHGGYTIEVVKKAMQKRN